MIDTAMSNKGKLLNKKKKRSENLQETEESNKTYSDTNETTQGKKNNKKRKYETMNLDSKNKNNIYPNNPRLNRFMSKEKYIQLNEETSMNKKGKKRQNRKKTITAKRQDKNYNKKVYSMNAKDKSIRRKNFRRKKSLDELIGRLMKKKDDENKKIWKN